MWQNIYHDCVFNQSEVHQNCKFLNSSYFITEDQNITWQRKNDWPHHRSNQRKKNHYCSLIEDPAWLSEVACHHYSSERESAQCEVLWAEEHRNGTEKTESEGEREGQLSCGVFALHAAVCQASSFLQSRGSSRQRQAKPAQQASKHWLTQSRLQRPNWREEQRRRSKGEEGGKSVVQLLQSLPLLLTESISPTHHLKNICCLPFSPQRAATVRSKTEARLA